MAFDVVNRQAAEQTNKDASKLTKGATAPDDGTNNLDLVLKRSHAAQAISADVPPPSRPLDSFTFLGGAVMPLVVRGLCFVQTP